MDSRERNGSARKDEWNDGEFESFIAEITPALETSVGRLGVAGSLGAGVQPLDHAKFVFVWPDISDRVVEETH